MFTSESQAILSETLSESIDSLLIQKLSQNYSSLQELMGTTEMELIQRTGIEIKKAKQVVSIIKLAMSMYKYKNLEGQIKSPKDLLPYFIPEYKFATKEHFIGVFLNSKNRLIHKEVISIGTLNSAIVHPREVFNAAIRHCSASLICVHNHPSGDPTPSQEDIQITKRLVEAGNIIGIDVLDHVIIGENRYYSLKEHGHM